MAESSASAASGLNFALGAAAALGAALGSAAAASSATFGAFLALGFFLGAGAYDFLPNRFGCNSLNSSFSALSNFSSYLILGEALLGQSSAMSFKSSK